MKCGLCGAELGEDGYAVTLVTPTRSFTAVASRVCMLALVGTANEHKLARMAMDAGWKQDPLPGFPDTRRPH